MDSRYEPADFEKSIYKMWERGGYFSPSNNRQLKIDNRQPYTILLPPPNASGKMHTGNVLMIAIEDLLIRWKRMKGFSTLWIPGTDHAGFETQITFERELKKQGLSRFDFDRQTLYKRIEQYVLDNKSAIDGQIRSMGASVDWSRYLFMLDKKVLQTVWNTFDKLYKDGLIYRDDYMVNFCPKCGTTFADLEVVYIERKDPLYYIQYGPFVLATVRPETKFGDTAVAVHPKDPRYKKYIGETIEVEGLIGTFKLKVIADNFVDPKFATGVVKVTPAHDKNDYEAGKRHNLEVKQVIDINGRLTDLTGPYKGMTVYSARKKVVEDLEKKDLIVKIDTNYTHTVAVCYKGGHDIEPTILPNWFIKVDDPKKSLKKPALEAVKKGVIKIHPKWREKTYTRWMEEMHDWPISRQNVWGIRIPVWYDVDKNPTLQVTFIPMGKEPVTDSIVNLLKTYSLEEIEKGLQKVFASKDAVYVISPDKPKKGKFLPETDTFDAWFSSGQWPITTLGYPDSADFKRFYPTDVLETGWEIVRLWVSRMVMFGYYLTGKPPFKDVYLHGIVRARDGRKMSKSLGNVINPEEYQQKYGTDALRMGLISATANGKDFNFPHDRIIAYQKFANKLWNIGRFILLQNHQLKVTSYDLPASPAGRRITSLTISQFPNFAVSTLSKSDKSILNKLNKLIESTDTNLTKFRFSQAADDIYHFLWHEFADKYVENVKSQLSINNNVAAGFATSNVAYALPDDDVAARPWRANNRAIEPSSNNDDKNNQKLENTLHVLNYVYLTCLKLLHPFMPFVTEAIWQQFPNSIKGTENPLIIVDWPIVSNK